MHILCLVESDPRNWKAFEDWINSRDYGSRTYCREIRLYDINCNERVLDKFLADLRHYYKPVVAGEKSFNIFYRIYLKLLRLLKGIIPIHPIDMSKVEKTPEMWFEPYTKYLKKVRKSGAMKHTGQFMYILPIGYLKDRKHEKSGDERI